MRLVVALLIFASSCTVLAADEQDLERLLEIGDERFQPLTEPLRDPPFLHRKVLTISTNTLRDGWVTNFQCHGNFAKVPALQIVFRPNAVRNIKLVQIYRIGKAWVEGATIQLEDVATHSQLCFRSENRIVERDRYTGLYRLKAGPFYYRFLDGYFPMKVDLTIRYPEKVLELYQISPDTEPGISVTRKNGQVHLSSLFQGKLWVEVLFKAVN